MAKIIDIFKVFFKVGVIGFGGGSALIPVVEKEIVNKKKWFNDEEYLKHTVISNITPGTLPVKLGAIAGYELGGGLGSAVGAYAVTLPGTLLTILLMMLFTVAGNKIAHYIEFASVGISIFIISLLIMYILKVINSGKELGTYKQYILICILSFIVTGGKELRQVFEGILGSSLVNMDSIMFDIPTINLIIIAFFMILFVGLMKSRNTFIIGTLISLSYAIICGKNNLIQNTETAKNILSIIMIFLVIYALNKSRESDSKGKIKFNFTKQMGIALILLLGLPIALIIVAIIMMPSDNTTAFEIVGYGKDVLASTVTSFGGGEAYVAVADGFFVQTGMVDAGDFYNKLVAVANALPGPILVKIASGIGYIFGGSIGGILYGWILAILGMAIAVGSCSALALVVLMGYDALKELEALQLLKKYILPVVCGMLISTSLSMIAESMKITAAIGISGAIVMVIIMISLSMLYIIHKKYHINDIILLTTCAGVSFVVLNFIK